MEKLNQKDFAHTHTDSGALLGKVNIVKTLRNEENFAPRTHTRTHMTLELIVRRRCKYELGNMVGTLSLSLLNQIFSFHHLIRMRAGVPIFFDTVTNILC